MSTGKYTTETGERSDLSWNERMNIDWKSRALKAEEVLRECRRFLKTYQRSNASWHNDQPTYEFIRDKLDPLLEP